LTLSRASTIRQQFSVNKDKLLRSPVTALAGGT